MVRACAFHVNRLSMCLTREQAEQVPFTGRACEQGSSPVIIYILRDCNFSYFTSVAFEKKTSNCLELPDIAGFRPVL